MGVDSQAVGNSAAAHRIVHDGTVFEFRLIDQAAKAEWEKALYWRAVEALPRIASMKPAGWKENKLVELDDEFLNGGFAFLGERSAKALKTVEGMGLLLSILTGKSLAELTPLLLAKTLEVRALLHVSLRESFPGVKLPAEGEENDLPK